jgi:hypothetical protein
MYAANLSRNATTTSALNIFKINNRQPTFLENMTTPRKQFI